MPPDQLRRKEITISIDNTQSDVIISEREREILNMVAEMKTNREIADKLIMSQRSIEYYLTQIYSKLNVKTRDKAVLKARKLGIISKEPITSINLGS